MRVTKSLAFIFLFQLFFVFAQAKSNLTCSYLLKPVFIDFHSKWGYSFLPHDDPAWQDPKYIKTLISYAAPDHTDYDGEGLDIKDRFYEEMYRLGAEGNVVAMTGSGTSANNLLFDMVQSHQNRTKHPKRDLKPQFIRIGPAYLGTNGAISRGGTEPIPDYMAPYIHPNKVLSKEELKEIEALENQTLKKIKKMVKKKNKNYAAVFLELVSTSHYEGLTTYRKEFLHKLQKLSQKLDILIFVDEVMSGGGRTGEFWAYQHFDGFKPDLVTFGKGLVISGVFEPYGSRYEGHSALDGVTSSFNILALIQATHVLKQIRKRKLIKNAKKMGKYLLETINKKVSGKRKANFSPYNRGFGLILTARIPSNWSKYNLGHGERLLPPLTLSKYEIDSLFDEED